MVRDMHLSCESIEYLLTGYVDGELTASKRSQVEAHVASCLPCQQTVEFERNLKAALQGRRERAESPPHLQERVRRQLAREALRSSRGKGLGLALIPKAGVGLALASLVVIFIGLPAYFSVIKKAQPLSARVVPGEGKATVEGTLICINCTLLQLAGEEGHHDVTHLVGLRTSDGTIWSFLDDGEGRKLSHALGYLDKNIVIQGHIFQQANYIQVDSFRLI